MAERTTYTTTTTTTSGYAYAADPVIVREVSGPGVDCGYLRTLPGIVKLVAIILCFICFLCVLAGGAGYFAGAGFATFVAIMGLLLTLSLLCLYVFHVIDMLPQIPWIIGEMVYCFVWAILFFIAGCMLAVAAAQFAGGAGWGIAAFFAFGAMCTYAFDCYLKFLAWKHNETPTGYSS